MDIVYNTDKTYLQHHGILGQKWGVRRFQNLDGSYTTAGRARYGIKSVTFGGDNTTKNEWDHSEKTHDLRDAITASIAIPTAVAASVGAGIAARTGEFQLIPITAAAGATAGLVLAGGVAVKHALAVHGVKKIETANKASGEIDESTGFYKKEDREYSRNEDIKAVNPGYKTFDTNNKNNCYLCTLTYDLRQRGYAVSANKAAHGFQAEDLKRWYPKAKVKTGGEVTSVMDDPLHPRKEEVVKEQKAMIERTFSDIEKQGPGARGYLGIKYFMTTSDSVTNREYVVGAAGHAMAYEVNSSGKIEIIDAQTNKVFSDPRNANRFSDIGNILNNAYLMSYARLDNVAIDPENIKEVAH